MPIDPSAQPGETPEPIPPSTLPPFTAPPPGSSVAGPVLPGAGQSSTGLEPNIAAGLSTVATVITGIIFLLIEKRDAYVRFWAMQSTVFGVAWIVAAVVSAIVHVVLYAIFFPLGWLWSFVSGVVELGFLVVWIIMMIEAFSGKQWEVPFIGRIARQQIARNPNIGL